MPPREFYHGTSLEAALAIQRDGFNVELSGSNAGAMLGDGLYITTTLEKALNYAKPKPNAGAIFRLQVDLGRCYTVTDKNDPLRRTWADEGYDSAWSKAGLLGVREENCVKDPARCVWHGTAFQAGSADHLRQHSAARGTTPSSTACGTTPSSTACGTTPAGRV